MNACGGNTWPWENMLWFSGAVSMAFLLMAIGMVKNEEDFDAPFGGGMYADIPHPAYFFAIGAFVLGSSPVLLHLPIDYENLSGLIASPK